MAVSLTRFGAIAGLAALAHGRPTNDYSSVSPAQISKRGVPFPTKDEGTPFSGDASWDFTDTAQLCHASFDSPEKAAEVWWKSGAGTRLDVFISNYDSTDPDGGASGADQTGTGGDWYNQMVSYVYGESTRVDCSSLSGGCDMPSAPSCEDLVAEDKFSDWWILQTVETMHAVFQMLHNQLVQDSGITATLAIPQIVSDFKDTSQKDEIEKIIGILGTAMSAAVPLIGDSTLGTAASVFSAIFSTVGAVAPDPDEGDESAELSKIVENYFSTAAQELQNTLLNVLGQGNQKFLPTKARTEQWIYKTETAHFMAGGKWLIKDVGKVLNEYIPKVKEQVKLSLVIHLLQQRNYHVYIIKNMDESECKKIQSDQKPHNFLSSRFMKVQDKEGCFILADNNNHGGSDHPNYFPPRALPDDQYEKLEKDYGFKAESFFTIVTECALLGPNESDDVFTQFRSDPHTLTRCQFQLPVYETEYSPQHIYLTLGGATEIKKG